MKAEKFVFKNLVLTLHFLMAQSGVSPLRFNVSMNQ